MIPNRSSEIVDQYYQKHYTNVHSTGCLGKANQRIHERIENPRTRDSYDTTLELGVGNFEHTAKVRHSWREYIATDIRTPQLSLLSEMKLRYSEREFDFVVADALHLPFPDGYANRVVAGCLLIHLPDPIEAVVEWQRVCSPRGVVDFLVPCDPGLALRAFRRVFAERNAKKRGVPRDQYRLVNAIEHMSPFGRVLELTRASLENGRNLRVTYYPFPWIRSWNMNAFAIFSIEPDLCP